MSELWRLSAIELASAIAGGETSSEEVVGAHIDRIESVNGSLNAMVLRRYSEALAEARKADARRANGEPLGPLHGVPVTIKDELDVAGLPSTFGLPSRVSDRAEADDPYVARLRAAGAIILGKTNVPQLMLFIETDNPLYGRTNNPWNLARSPGGSSGGEAAIVAAGGSPLGLGSDIGGSLRAPAAACGIFSLLPTCGRTDAAARVPMFFGQRAIVSQEGPLARSAADVALALEIINGGRDPDVLPPRPLRAHEAVDVRDLRIGFFEQAGRFRAAPALARATREAADLFARMGARVVPFEAPLPDDAFDIFYGILAADGGRGTIDFIGSNKRDPRIDEIIKIVSQSRATLALLELLLGVAGQPTLRRVIHNYGRTDTHHYLKLVEAQRSYAALFARALDTADGGPLDLVVCPPCGLPALKHGESANVMTAGVYAPLFNLLGYPAGTAPFTRVRAEEEHGRKNSRDRVERGAYHTEADSAGLPAGVQIVGRPWREDTVLAAMLALEGAIRGRPDFPATPVTPAN